MSSSGRLRLVRPAEAEDPVTRLWHDLPELWRGPVIGQGIGDWERYAENDAAGAST